MNNDKKYGARVALGTLKEVKSQYDDGFFLLGKIGMAQMRIQRTKAGDKWVVYLQEEPQHENRGYAQPPQQQQRPQQRPAPQKQAPSPPQRYAPESHFNGPPSPESGDPGYGDEPPF